MQGCARADDSGPALPLKESPHASLPVDRPSRRCSRPLHELRHVRGLEVGSPDPV